MALVRFSSVEITHCPAMVAMKTASPANARSDTETSDPDPNDDVTADSVVTGARSTSSLVTGGPQLTKALSASSCSSVVFESLSPGVCLDLRGFSVLSLAPADKKVRLLVTGCFIVSLYLLFDVYVLVTVMWHVISKM